ncbi:MAG TPA: hypothetical protein VKH42_06180, partial [Vicinamibacterales bacterium]|nr:hypothetical protein [Vicinamibacterales bacterium]
INSKLKTESSLRKELDVRAGNQSGLDALDFVGDRRELAVGVRFVGADRHDRQPCALPQVVVFDFGDRDVEFLQAILDPPQDHAFVLQRLAAGHVQFD